MIHPESFAINYIKFKFSSPPPPQPSFLIFLPPRFQFGHHKSVFPLALFSHFHRFPHYSVGRSGPMSTLFIIIMYHCASRHIRPPCCLTNTFSLEQPLWLLPSFSTPLCFALSQLSFSKQFLVFLSPFNLQESFGIQHVLSSKMSPFINNNNNNNNNNSLYFHTR